MEPVDQGARRRPNALLKPTYLVYVAAGDPERFMMVANGLGVGSLEEAVDVAIGIVIQLNLTYAELVSFSVPGVRRDLVDSLCRELQVVVEVHELGHVPLSLSRARSKR
jgi:hypothetical protein